jgi:hypothetical protein
MGEVYNVYCDESCHLENDHQGVMVLGAMWCPLVSVPQLVAEVRAIKIQYGIPSSFEIKWTKISPAKVDFYLALVRYFFSQDDLHFRALIVPDKSLLRHKENHQTHDEWYYKMYFDMLKIILSPHDQYRIYLDIKDTRGGTKIKRLHEVLCNNMFDFSRSVVERIQLVRSHEVDILQLADLFIGAIAAANRDTTSSPAKQEIIDLMRSYSGYSLDRSTLYRENKINLFRWHARRIAE